MYSTSSAITTSIKNLLEQLNDYDIYSYYLGNIKLGKLINSPLRSGDDDPSFAIFKSRNGDILFKDHGSGETGNSLKFVKLYKNITTRHELEQELLRIIKRMNPTSTIRQNRVNYVSNSSVEIGIVRQSFTNVDIEYWKQFHISVETLKLFNVFSIKYFLCNSVVKGTYRINNPMYAYKVYDKFKIYRPLDKNEKWRTNLTRNHIQGLEQLPKDHNKLLIITKSLKDVMCLYEMGFDSISPSSETTFIPENILNVLKSKYNNIVILFDRDKTGMIKSRDFSKQYGLDAIFVHKKFKSKDISDAIKNNKFDDVKDWLTKTLKQYD